MKPSIDVLSTLSTDRGATGSRERPGFKIPARRTRIAIAVDRDLLIRPGKYSNRPYYVDYIIPIIETLKNSFEHVDVLGIESGPDGAVAIKRLQELEPELIYNTAFSAVAAEASFVGALELLDLRYTGASMMGLALSRDKPKCSHLLHSHGIDVPAGIVLTPNSRIDLSRLSYPVIVKPALYGASSRGIHANSVANDASRVMKNVQRIWDQFQGPALCQEFIIGTELRLSVIKGEGRKIHIVGVSECSFPTSRPGWGFKTARLRESQAARDSHQVRSRLLAPSKDLQQRFSRLAVDALNILDIRGPATLDLRMQQCGRLVLIEVNANPGLTPNSAAWSSPSFDENILRIVAEGLGRYR